MIRVYDDDNDDAHTKQCADFFFDYTYFMREATLSSIYNIYLGYADVSSAYSLTREYVYRNRYLPIHNIYARGVRLSKTSPISGYETRNYNRPKNRNK